MRLRAYVRCEVGSQSRAALLAAHMVAQQRCAADRYAESSAVPTCPERKADEAILTLALRVRVIVMALCPLAHIDDARTLPPIKIFVMFDAAGHSGLGISG